MALTRGSFCALGASVALLGCSKPDAPPHRTEPWLANPSASSNAPSSAPRHYRFTSDSRISFSLSGHKGKLSGRVPVGGGELRLDPRELKQTQARLDVDLTKLEIETPAPEGFELGASSPTALALQWLELGPSVPAERRAQYSEARFELHSLENLSAPYIALDGKPSSVRAAAVGTLLIHGFRAPVRAEVVLRTLPDSPGLGRLSIRSMSALVVPLIPHDITARDPAGVIDALGAARSADWVGKAARVEFELTAQPDPK